MITDYVNDKILGEVNRDHPVMEVSFTDYLLLRADPLP